MGEPKHENLVSEYIIETDSIPTIFQVPKATKETKPEAYTPNLLGLGPYHHLRPELYNADRQKLLQVKKFLKQHTPCRDLFDKKRGLEVVVRANYDKYLDLEGSTLEYIIAIDSIYLLDLLGWYDERTDDEAENLEAGRRELAKDVIMLENQIPAFALVKMGKDLDLFSPCTVRGTYEQNTEEEEDLLSPVRGTYEQNTEEEDIEAGEKVNFFPPERGTYEQNTEAEEDLEMGKEEEDDVDGTKFQQFPEVMLYSHMFYSFCNAHSPLKLAGEIRPRESQHLLAQMYDMIVNNDAERFYYPYLVGGGGDIRRRWYSEIEECLTILREVGFNGTVINPLLFAFKSLHVLVNSRLIGELTRNEEQKPKIQKIEIPSASELSSEKHRVQFHPIWNGGIKNIKLFPHRVGTLVDIFLPRITLRSDSEVVLRNLVAYEAAVKSSFEFAEYVDLMCGMVHPPKDVALLRKRHIVNGDLNDEQVAEMFNGISRCVGESKEESTSQKVVKQVKGMVEEWEKQKWYRRQYRSLKKIVKIAVQFIRKPLGIVVKYLMFIFMVLLLVLQILQAYCLVYGCNMGGSKANAISLMMSA